MPKYLLWSWLYGLVEASIDDEKVWVYPVLSRGHIAYDVKRDEAEVCVCPILVHLEGGVLDASQDVERDPVNKVLDILQDILRNSKVITYEEERGC